MKILFRIIRNTLVLHLRAEGLSWAYINRILRCLGQKVIVKVDHEDTAGMTLTYGRYVPKFGLRSKSQNNGLARTRR